MEEIAKTLLALPAERRREIRDELSLSLLMEKDEVRDAAPRMRELLPLAVKATGLAAYADDNSRASCLVKRFIVWQMYREGFSFEETAAALGKHRTTVNSLFYGMQNRFSCPVSYRDDLKKWDIFQKLIDDETEQ